VRTTLNIDSDLAGLYERVKLAEVSPIAFRRKAGLHPLIKLSDSDKK